MKTATRKLYVQNVQTLGILSIIRGRDIWSKYHKAQELILSSVCTDKNYGNKVTSEINYNKKLNFKFHLKYDKDKR